MESKYIVISAVVACAILYFVEQVLMVDYFIKTLSKVLLFTIIPLLFIRFIKGNKSKEKFIHINKQGLKLGVLFGVICFVIILISYFIFGKYIDMKGIISELQNKSKITPTNFIIVGTYITLGNSFLEEFFFRGFIFLNLYEMGYKKTAYVLSSFLFGLYHIAIFKTWFNVWLIGLVLIGLVSIGFIFDWLDTKSKNFVNSWIVHILADSAIILIGMRMFSII